MTRCASRRASRLTRTPGSRSSGDPHDAPTDRDLVWLGERLALPRHLPLDGDGVVDSPRAERGRHPPRGVPRDAARRRDEPHRRHPRGHRRFVLRRDGDVWRVAGARATARPPLGEVLPRAAGEARASRALPRPVRDRRCVLRPAAPGRPSPHRDPRRYRAHVPRPLLDHDDRGLGRVVHGARPLRPAGARRRTAADRRPRRSPPRAQAQVAHDRRRSRRADGALRRRRADDAQADPAV